MGDQAHDFAERKIAEFQAEVRETYQQAQADAQEALSRFLKRFEKEDERQREKVKAGELSEADYKAWRKGKILRSRQLSSTLDQVSQAMTEANQVAMAALRGKLPEVYAENANYAAFSICKETGVAVAFDLVDPDTVGHMLTAGAALLPAVDAAKDVAWNRKLVSSQLTQGVLLGESIPKIARRVQSVTGSNIATATRTARTAVTGAECAGRMASYKRAKGMGIKLKKEWVSTLDNRTRHSHRQLDGERIENKESAKFSNGCRYPGDPTARYAEICNCRCTVIAAVEGFETDDAERWSKLPKGMTYEEWKAGGSGKKAAEALQASISGGQAVSANAVRSIVGKHVPLGPSAGKNAASYIDLQGMGERGAKLFDRAVSYVPTAMLETVKRGKVKAVRDLSSGRDKSTERDESPKRSEFDPATNTITIRRGSDELTIVHELMHAVEEHDPEFLEAEREYFEKRTRGKARARLYELTGNDEYDDSELAYDVGGKCVDPYMFKDYGGSGYELMSMGVEMLYRSPSAYSKDFEMLKWVLSMLGRFSA
nr:MAG TPA: minor capsid protein [Caudoviricetes sp.]